MGVEGSQGEREGVYGEEIGRVGFVEDCAEGFFLGGSMGGVRKGGGGRGKGGKGGGLTLGRHGLLLRCLLREGVAPLRRR